MNSGTCADPAIAGFVIIIKNIMTVFQIVVPIILIVSVAYSLVMLVLVPDDHRPPPRRGPGHMHRAILYQIGAAVLVFFLPYIFNLAIAQIPDQTFSIVDCWNSAEGNDLFQWNAGGKDIDSSAPQEQKAE